jgi:hypothetical protein
MKRQRRRLLAWGTIICAACVAAGAGEEPPLKLLTAGFLGTAEDDDLQGAAGAPDGTVYLVGNTGTAAGALPGGVTVKVYGEKAAEPRCGRAFIAHFSKDFDRLLHYAECAEGVALFTTVQANANGVYVGGYASEALEPLLKDKGGLIAQYPLATEARLIREGKMLDANGLKDKDPLAGRPGLGRLGAPCVLRFTPDLQKLDAGTYLEGWQQVWDKYRVKVIRPHETFPPDYFWQPTALAPLKSGDLIVGHDGGYFRLLTEKDRELAAGNDDLLHRLAFYDCCDWLSRLSADLSKRVWRQPIYTPKVDVETAKRVRGGWPLPHYSSPRTHRVRLDWNESIYLCGWSASCTAKEPWWAPYVWKLDPADGKVIWKAYEYDPMSGADNRMNGTVADTAIPTLALDGDGNLLVSLFADGGNTVMGWSPQAELGKRFEGPLKNNVGVKLVHWWGMIHRVNGQTREGLGGVRLASKGKTAAGPAWVVDLASLPGNGVLAVGRCNFEFPWSDNAWQRGDPDENPTAFLRVYDREFELLFSTALPGVVPFEVVPLPEDRFIIVGRAEHDTAPARNAPTGAFHGKSEGWFAVVQAVGKQE